MTTLLEQHLGLILDKQATFAAHIDLDADWSADLEHGELDIGDASIGMHIKHVQIPLRPQQRELGGAHVCALASRPRLIGGERAGHYKDSIRRM